MTAGRMQRGAKAGRAPADTRVAAMLARHGGALMRVARQWSLCHDDALDAFQRGLEIFVRRMETVDPATEAAWLKVVIRHEAMAIRRSRADCVSDPELDLDGALPAPQRSVEEQVLSGDRVSRSAEALRALKPDEARALMLKAHGMSYDEIGRHCGWTYTKVNRAITEGRRRFMEVYEALEEGSECERFAPVLRALADGRATSEQLVEVRPHLRRCLACRATVRELHRGRLPVLLPGPFLGWALEWLREHLPPGPTTFHGDPIPAPAAPGRLQRLKQHALSVMHRTNSSDLAASIHIASSSGGGRIATVGAIVGLCLSGVGAGTVCLVTGVLEPPRLFGLHTPTEQRHDARGQHSERRHKPRHSHSAQLVRLPSPPPSTSPTRVLGRHSNAHVHVQHASPRGAPSRAAGSPAPAADKASVEFGFEPTPTTQAPTAASPAAAAAPTSTPRTTSTVDPAEEEFGP